MLLQMRTFTRSWIAYVLLFLLVAAFAIWGINDAFNGVGSQYLAEVAGRSITPAQLQRELELTLRGERSNGNNITTQEAVDQGLHRRLLEGMIARDAIYAYAERMGISASNAQVARRIREIPAVTNPVTNSFDEAAYDAFLNQMRYTRREFEEDIRGDLTRQMLLEAMLAGVRAPSSYGAMLLTYEAETRVVSIAEAPLAAAGNIPQPNEAQLQAFYEESQEQLRIPEFRALTLVYARPQDFLARVNIPEAQLREEFEARRAALSEPERRTYSLIAARTEAQADDALSRLNRGESAQAVATAMGLQVSRGENRPRTEVTDARVAEAVFDMRANTARKVQGELTPWAVVRVDSVTPEVSPTFEQHRDEIRQALAADQAAELMTAAVSSFEDARSAGGSIAEAARQSGLAVVAVPSIEAQGRDRDGQPVAALADQEELLTTAFETPEGEASDFIPVGDTDVIVAVDSITPSTVQPLEEVRADLTRVWIGRERARRLREMADDVVSAVQGGQSFAAAARANRFNVVISSRELDRRTASQIPARGLGAQLFAGQEGAVVSDPRADGQAMLVAIIEEINRVDPATQPQAVEAARAQMQQSLAQSMGSATQDEIVNQAHPRRNERLLNQAFRPSASEDQEGQ